MHSENVIQLQKERIFVLSFFILLFNLCCPKWDEQKNGSRNTQFCGSLSSYKIELIDLAPTKN